MMNNIYEKQNELHTLKCIAAQRKEYNKAKKIKNFGDFCVAGFAIFSIVASFIDNDLMTACTFLLAGLTAVIGKYVDRYVCEHKNIAANIQQYVDVTLYNFVLEDKISDWGKIYNFSELAEIIGTVTDKESEEVENWYSDYSGLTPIEQVFYCQKENLRWDIKLRCEFRNLIFIIIFTVVLVLFIVAIVINPSLIKLLNVISWMLPLIDFCYFYCSNLKKDIKRLEDLKEKSDKISGLISKKEFHESYDTFIEKQKIKRKLINLQKGILKNRLESILIPNWFYKIRQNKHQKDEDKIASQIQNKSRE